MPSPFKRSPLRDGKNFSTRFDTEQDTREFRRRRREALQNDVNESQQPATQQAKNNQNETLQNEVIKSRRPAKRHAKNRQNETEPSKDNENNQFSTNDREGNSAATVTVGEVSEERADVSTLSVRSKGSSSTISSSKQQWAGHLEVVKTVVRKDVPNKWIANHKFSNRVLADSILKPYLKQTDPDIPPIITIAPGLSEDEFVELAFRKHMTPIFNEWRHKTQSAMKNMYFSK